MKKLLSLLLMAAMLLTLTACTGNQSKDKENSEPFVDEKAILDKILENMSESDSSFSYEYFVDDFFGDFSIKRFDSSTGITDMFKKRGYVVTNRTGANSIYQTLKNNKLYTVNLSDHGSGQSVRLQPREDWPYEYPLSIFTAFGVDMSSVYSTENTNIQEPTLTLEDLSFSKDKKTVKFSDRYLKELATALTASFEFTDSELEEFLSSMDASGKYTHSEEKYSFNIFGEVKNQGKFTINASYAYKNSVPHSSEIEISLEKDGILSSMKMVQKDMKIEDGKLVAITLESTQKAVQKIASTKTTTVKKSSFSFETKDGSPSKVLIDVNADVTSEYSDTKKTSNSTLKFQVVNGNLTYELTSDGTKASNITASGVVFGTPADKTINSDVARIVSEN